VGAFIIFLILCYFIPTVIALLRKHKDAPAIAAINILLGWSFIGWFVSFIWALSDPRGRNAPTTVIVNNAVSATGYHSPPPAAPAPEPSPAPTQASSDPDTAYWDRIDKNDADSLEEYLIRHPNGRFGALARSKLDRLNGSTSAPAPAPAPAPSDPAPDAASSQCGACNSDIDPGARFCGECGAPAPA